MSPLISYIRCATQNYAAYYRWENGPVEVRGKFLCSLKRDWECIAALYRVERRKAYYGI